MVKTLVMKGKSTSGAKIEDLARDSSTLSNVELNIYNLTTDTTNFEITCTIEIINDDHNYDYQLCLVDVHPNTLSHSEINVIMSNDNDNVFSESNISRGVITNKQIKFSNNVDELNAIDSSSLYSQIKPTGEYYISLRTFYDNRYLSITERTFISDLIAPTISNIIISTKNLFTINVQCNIEDNSDKTSWYISAFTSNVSVVYSDADIIEYMLINNKYTDNSSEYAYNLNVDVECAYDYFTNKIYSLTENTTYYIYVLVIDSGNNRTISNLNVITTPISHPNWNAVQPSILTQASYDNGKDIIGFGSEFINLDTNIDDSFHVWHIFDNTYTYDEAKQFNVTDQNRHVGWLSGLKTGSLTDKQPTNYVYIDLQSSKTISGLKIYNYGVIGLLNFEEIRTNSVQVYLGDSLINLGSRNNLIASGSNYANNEDWLMNVSQSKTGRYMKINIENSGSQSSGVGIHEVEIFGY